MRFTKMHGAGNDFIIINNINEGIPIDDLGDAAEAVCRRCLSIGADGFIAVDRPESGGDFKMYFFNADGTMAEMCGNGARCIARYGYENGLSGAEQIIETTSGMVYGQRESENLYRIKLNNVTKLEQDCSLDIDGKTYQYSYVELGNPGLPHMVTEVPQSRPIAGSVSTKGLENPDRAGLCELGRKMRSHPAFVKGTNVNFYEVIGENELKLLTYERGVEDFTLACGTGAGATVASLTLAGRVNGNNTKINVPGGELFVTAINNGGKIEELFLTGPTCVVAVGELYL